MVMERLLVIELPQEMVWRTLMVMAPAQTTNRQRSGLWRAVDLLNMAGMRFVHTVKYSRYLVDENWRIISVDDNFEELTGYSKEDIENNIITQIDLIPDEDKQNISVR